MQEAIEQLGSLTAAGRASGFQTLRGLCNKDEFVATFHITSNNEAKPKRWLVVLQAVFAAVAADKAVFNKKTSSATGRKRLVDAAGNVRWLIERTVKFLNNGVFPAVIAHLLKYIAHEQQLFEPVALDYIKALRCVLEFSPHLDRIEDLKWIQIVELAFKVILDDPLSSSYDFASDPDPAKLPTSPRTKTYDDDDDSDSSVATPSRKRRRGTPRPLTLPQATQQKRIVLAVSQEKTEMIELLRLLLQSPSAPFLLRDRDRLASSVLLRLQRFLDSYHPDSSLYPTYLLILLHTLSHLSLNRKDVVIRFAQTSWDSLVGLWGAKDRSKKERLVAVLVVLFPFFTHDAAQSGSTSFDWSSGIEHLWRLLDGEAESRRGIDGLALDRLRLEVASEGEHTDYAFVARTFRAALAWAILELQADCAEKLFQHSESIHSAPATETQRGRKRARSTDPVTYLLDSLHSPQQQAQVRSYHLQTLLFFIDRHWSVLHDTLQQAVFSTLIQFLSVDEATVQSWSFLCFAAIATADIISCEGIPANRDWDTIWTHAIRRTNVPAVSRGASHAAHVLLLYSRSQSPRRLSLTPQRVLLEIESLVKDLDVQGPPVPHDSVCAFLAQALKVASQDVRLYRMQFEDKALSWINDCWSFRGSGGSSSWNLPLNMVKDIMLLLETICGLSKRSDLFCRVILPDCLITETLVDQAKTKTIRDYLLTATLPSFETRVGSKSLETPSTATDTSRLGDDQVEETPRERKLSTLFLKMLETLDAEMSRLASSGTHPGAEDARQVLDWVVTVISFESLLGLNGTRPNRRVIQVACKVMLLVAPLLKDERWTEDEKALVLLGLEPLTSTGSTEDDDEFSIALIPPDTSSGIKAETLQSLTSNRGRKESLVARRLDLQRLICKSTDVQDGFEAFTATLRDVLKELLGLNPVNKTNDSDMHFQTGPTKQATELGSKSTATASVRCIAQVSIAFLAVTPILRSVSDEATSDKELVELVLKAIHNPLNETSVFVYRSFLRHVRQKTLNLSKSQFQDFLVHFSNNIFRAYFYAQSEVGQMLAIELLDSTMHIWLSASGPLRVESQTLCSALPKALRAREKKEGAGPRTWMRSWKTRDALARFYDRFLALDPSEVAWYDTGFKPCHNPSVILPWMSMDEDIRVRFRVAVLNARLFAVGRANGQDPVSVYVPISENCPTEIIDFESILTRLVCLGNMMIASSNVRRGPYWHLLEGVLSSSRYSLHTEAILRGVSQRLGFSSFAVLFEAYASQLAYTIKMREADFLRFPPRLLGYSDRKRCAEANFRGLTPTNLVAHVRNQNPKIGRKLFEGHCKVIQKPVSEGILQCFADIVGYQILQTLLDSEAGMEMTSDELQSLLMESMMMENDPSTFQETLSNNADGVVTWIIQTLGDQDFGPEGPIAIALQAFDPDGKTADVFRSLVRYRHREDFVTHPPNVPAFPSAFVLRALSWFGTFMPDTDDEATAYHVTHELFAQIQRSPLVNEQLRLVNALCVWIAFRHDCFEQQTTLLHALIRGATSLMAQSDLARAAQSLLEWVFDCYCLAWTDDPRFSDVLIRIACLANDYARKSQHVLGKDLCAWIDSQALIMSAVKSKSLKASIVRALSAWPHTPSPSLAELCSSITFASLSTVLSDPSIISNKFRLVRQMRNHAHAEDRDVTQFAQTDFWRLRECIPSLPQLQDEDIDAFAGLLALHQGRISSFGSDKPTIRVRDASSALSPQSWIVHVLLTMLEGGDPSQIYLAYQTLRLILSVHSTNFVSYMPLQYKDELPYLQAYKRSPKTRPVRNLEELLTEDYLDCVADFPRWAAMIATLLSDLLSVSEPFYAQLALILESDVSFTEQALPVLVYSVLDNERITSKQPLSDLPRRKVLSEYFTAVLKSSHASVQCVRCIVEIVLHLRHFTPQVEKDLEKSNSKKADALSRDKWLAIDYTLLSRNSITCGAYTTSLLFLELAAEYGTGTDAEAEQILYDIYSHIDEPDGFYGIKTQDLHQFLIKRFHHEKQWDRAFRFHSATLEAGGTEVADTVGLLQSFHSFGFNHLAHDTLQNSSSASQSSGMNYRLGWRTETWDLPERKGEGVPGAPLYTALRAVYRERNPAVIQSIVRGAISEEMERLRSLGSENLAEIRDASQNLMCLNQISQWFQPSNQARLASRHADISQWSRFVDLSEEFEFSDFENLMATRISLVRSIRRKEERQQIGTLVSPWSQCLLDVEKQCLVRLSRAAREAQQNQIALNSVFRAQRLEQSPSLGVSEEYAHVLRVHKEEKVAVQFLKELDMTNLPPTDTAVMLARLGTWMAEACLENPTEIASRYFHPAASYINEYRNQNPTLLVASHATVYHQYAIFAAHQYKAIKNSPDAIRWKVYAERKTQEIRQRMQTQNNSSRKVLKDAQTLLKGDVELSQKHSQALQTFLDNAIEMYSRALEASDEFDGDGTIRLCSLWFENFDESEGKFQENVRSALERIPSRKLVFLAHQLVARLSKSTDAMENQQTLERVVLRMCLEHPFHSVYQVYSLLPQKSPTARRQSGRHNSPMSQSTARSDAAVEIFDRLRADHKGQHRMTEIESVASACLEWAKFPIVKTALDTKGVRNIPSAMALHRILGLKVPVLTYPTPLDPSAKYDSCVFIDKFENTFETAGGVNLPKITKCVGSDGARYRQLFKGEGNDDLRQDAVMEQVFDLVNTVLRSDRETSRRALNVRGYKIIPLGAQAGVMEFVANTIPMHSWLIPAHPRYNKNDLTPPVAAERMKRAWQEHHSEPEKQLARYLEVKKQFHPAMRHWFTEKHKVPMAWFAMRLGYTRSVATTSIVGHVLGLGDRHGNNILLDSSTGETVHIDLGIAFDQGKLLNVPEQVPFRMTSDIIDGMGTAGTQGVFQRCAEETLRVLRDRSEVIMTVLEVFKHDPLHSWTASEIKLQRVQTDTEGVAAGFKTGVGGIGIDMASGTADEAADRALSGVARKLDKTLSVEYTVNELLAEATDPMRLATIWHGWGAIY
ncbi:hypothetical protein FB45DRAFT_924928 [Roridomyces roridus]|uniref:Serine/threonine-protein kinase Tel1 n=1 Tax=Roridomyces roridus TaxID=1738132 RepID=A0AAD7BJJ4_9AGAR|nr:hypothetical protein FB45DRAFT_924928 [Roridomyces roridus]